MACKSKPSRQQLHVELKRCDDLRQKSLPISRPKESMDVSKVLKPCLMVKVRQSCSNRNSTSASESSVP